MTTPSRSSSEAPTLIVDGEETVETMPSTPSTHHDTQLPPTKDEKSSDDSDTLIVDWDGTDDPENPRNWSYGKKWSAIVIVSAFTFISPLSSSMIAPAAGQLVGEFNITSSFGAALTTSIFVLAYAIGPLFLGPLSEIYGRSRVLQVANMFFLAWNIGCGFAKSSSQIYAFRFLAGIGGSAPLSIGGAVVGDLFDPAHRGQAIALYSLAPLLGPVVGPIAGGWISEKSTWRWVFWASSIADGVIQLLGLYFLRETYAPLLLERKADKIRKTLDPEKSPYKHVRSKFQRGQEHWQSFFVRSIFRPFTLFAREPILQLFGLYMAFIYGLLYLVLTTIPEIYGQTYGQRPGIAGLHYIALGIGISGASQLNARLLDRMYKYFLEKNNGVGKPEFRLPSMVPASLLTPIGLLIFGWTAQYQAPWIAPDIGLVFIGAGCILNFQSLQTYIIDCFALHAASALAAVACFRSLAGFGFPLFAPAMYNALGYGKGDTVLAAFAVAIGIPAPWLFWKYGQRIRAMSRHAVKDEL